MGQSEGRLLDFLDSKTTVIILLIIRTSQVQMQMNVIQGREE